MILECAKNDVMPVYISLYDGNEARTLTYIHEHGQPGDYEQIRFRCKVNTEKPAAGGPYDDNTDGVYTIIAESEKIDSGAAEQSTAGSAKNFLKFAVDMKAIKAIPGRYPIDVSIVSYHESTVASAKYTDTERHKTTVAYADESYLIIHGEVE